MGICGMFDRLGRLPYTPVFTWLVANLPRVDGNVVTPSGWVITAEPLLSGRSISSSECEYDVTENGVQFRYRYPSKTNIKVIGDVTVEVNDSHFDSVTVSDTGIEEG